VRGKKAVKRKQSQIPGNQEHGENQPESSTQRYEDDLGQTKGEAPRLNTQGRRRRRRGNWE